MDLKQLLRQSAEKAGLSVQKWPPRESLGRILKQVVAAYRPDSVVDVGANEGQWASMLRRLGYDGSIVSLEPVSATFQRLIETASEDPRWSAMQLAAGRTPGELTINVPDQTGMASFRQRDDAALDLYADPDAVRKFSETRYQEQVSVVTLDSLDLPGERVLLKSDTQGFDMEVFEGAPGLLDRTVALQCEVSVQQFYQGMTNRWLDVLEWALDQGFHLAGMHKVATDARWRLIEMDAVFVRGDPYTTNA